MTAATDARRLLDAIGDRRISVGRVAPAPATVVELMHRAGLGPEDVAGGLFRLLHQGHLVVDFDETGKVIQLRRP